MFQLNTTLNPINPQERVKINQNWEFIMQRFSSLKNQINLLAGGEDLESVIASIEIAISNAERATTNTEDALTRVSEALNQLEILTSDVNTISNDVQTILNQINAILNAMVYLGEYNQSTTYNKGNYVRYQKSSYVALKQNTNIIPSDNGIDWRLIAVGGIDGQGSVVSVNGMEPDSNGNIQLDIINFQDFNVINVKNFGAIGDGIADDTTAINASVAAARPGDTIFFPKGIYILKNQIVLPKAVNLLGVCSDLAPQYADGAWDTRTYGSVIGIDFNEFGTDVSNGAFVLTSYNKIKGLNFWYPNQSGDTISPIPYPPTLVMAEEDPEESNGAITQVIIEDCVFVNPYICMSFNTKHELLTIRSIRFTAWYRGIIVENSIDVDRLSDIHSNPNISYRGFWPVSSIFSYHIANSLTKGLWIGKNDQIYIEKCFIFGFNTALELSSVSEGDVNGCFINQCGFEGCSRSVVLLGDYRRVSMVQTVLGTFNLYTTTETTIYATRSSNALPNELSIIDCHVFYSNGRPLSLENQNDVFVSKSHFYSSLSQPLEFQTDALRIFNCIKIEIDSCTLELSGANNNSIYYSIDNSNMISLKNMYFSGFSGDPGTSSSTIISSSHVRVNSPRYTNSTNNGTFQNSNIDVVIDDVIDY